jgi:hypothetical protein
MHDSTKAKKILKKEASKRFIALTTYFSVGKLNKIV